MVMVLIVEDQLIAATSLEKELNTFGYQVSEIVDSYESAIASVKQNIPDLAIVDIRLRGQDDGVDVARAIQNLAEIPIIFLTAHCDSKTLDRALSVSPYGYLTKPITRDNLSTTVAVALHKHQAEQKQKSKLNQEKEQSQIRSNYRDITYHDLRTPLTTLGFATEQLVNSESSESMVKMIQSSAARINQLIDQAASFETGNLSKLNYQATEVRIANFCLNTIEEILAVTEQKCPIRLVSDRWDLYTKIYRDLVWHILNNLLINAVKYSTTGSEIELKISVSEQSIVLQVSDQGMGIPEASLATIFNHGQRGANVGSIAGEGIGLSSVKQAVDRHGGAIEVVSCLGEGTTFKVILPVID
jgi:signal transduction histidine kinase